MLYRFFLRMLITGVCGWGYVGAQITPSLADPEPDQPQLTLQKLQRERQALPVQAIGPVELGHAMLRLGMWTDLEDLLSDPPASRDWALLQAAFALRQHRFAEAEALVAPLLQRDPQDFEAGLLHLDLRLQAWDLEAAEAFALQLLATHPNHPEVLYRLGQLEIFRKNYRKALALGEQMQAVAPDNADGYYLAGEAHIWLRDSEAAEVALRACLQRDPYHPDARFSYGYALWRRVDATLLDDMAAQWEVALAVHPLHFRTHWHWGNGHTQLTYADYIDFNEEEIRQALTQAETLIAENEVARALKLIAEVEDSYPQSMIPPLYRASAWYVHYDHGPARLDSAQRIFQDILQAKPHYGPAHNGLAAVIKQRQFPYLVMYDSLEQVIAQTEIEDPESFFEVFPDMDAYPGDRVPQMVWNQLYTGVAYFPFLAKLNRAFVIPPLHRDLALAMDNNYFRGGTTFDNRQWMDIRGVGSGATGIEYVERGAHLERNVTLHEYVHLFHGQVFTDAEMRAVRERYYYAMENDLTLDYYSANNEFEYLAQTFPAYFIPVKVHPLNHKAVNTRSDLQRKDPLMYAFIDSLVRKQRAFLAGDSSAMADNWAEVYRRLADRYGRNEGPQALAYLDTAWRWDSSYLPVYLSYAYHLGQMGLADSAQNWLQRAQARDSSYAPIYQAWADGVEAQYEKGDLDGKAALAQQEKWLRLALDYETDYDQRARLTQQLWDVYLRFGQWQEAVETAEGYAIDAPEVSTYLRDRRDEALAVAAVHRGQLGYAELSLDFLRDLVQRKPQRYYHRQQLAEVLLALGQAGEALAVLRQAQRILEAANNRNEAFDRLMARAYLMQTDTAAAREIWDRYQLEGAAGYTAVDWGLLAVELGELETAADLLTRSGEPRYPVALAEQSFLRGQLALAQGDTIQSVEAWKAALTGNLYHLPARFALLEILQAQGESEGVRRIATAGTLLPLPPGPAMMPRLTAYLEQ